MNVSMSQHRVVSRKHEVMFSSDGGDLPNSVYVFMTYANLVIVFINLLIVQYLRYVLLFPEVGLLGWSKHVGYMVLEYQLECKLC